MNELTKNEKFDEKKISDILKNLKESSTFNMSRGGRELFHTNFLAFILDGKYEDDCQSYEAQVKKLILQQLFGVENTPKNVITFRERSNLDLIVIPVLNELDNKKKVVVIEAKLKSIPTSEQLEKYNNSLGYGEKASKIHLELYEDLDTDIGDCKSDLSVPPAPIPSKISFNRNSITVAYRKGEPKKSIEIVLERFLLAPSCLSLVDLKGWELLEWNFFLNSINPKLTTPTTLFGQLVADYISSTKQVLTLVNQVDRKRSEFTSGKEDFNNFYDFSVIAKDFRNARLHDLVGKVAYSGLQKRLVADLKDLLDKYKETLDLKDFEFEAYTFFSNSVPGLGIQYKCVSKKDVKRSICIGVQFQGNDYRHFVESNGYSEPEYKLKKLAGKIEEWICPFETKTDKLKVFGETKFVYQSVRLQIGQQIKSSNKPIDVNTQTYALLREKFKSSLKGALDVINDKDFLSNLKGDGF